MEQKYIMGIDIGSSNIKAIIFSLTGDIISSSSEEIVEIYPASRQIEQDPKEIWNKFCKTVNDTVKKSGINPIDIAGVGFDSNRCGLILLDGKYKPLTNLMTWRDTRSEDYVQSFANENPEIDLYRITGEEGRPQHTLFKILWCQNETIQTWEQCRHILFSPKDYIFLKLFNKCISSKSMAQSTGLFDINLLAYSEVILDRIHINESMLPQLFDSNSVVGNLNSEISEVLGLAENTPVICGLCDATASQVGSGSVHEGDFTVSIGTCGAIRSFSSLPQYAENKFSQIRIFSPYGYVPTCTITDAGSVLKWFRNNFCKYESFKSNKSGTDVYTILDEAAAKVSAGCEGLLLLPNFTGASYAFKDVSNFGMFAGIRNYHTHAHFIRAILEGVGMSLRTIFDNFKEDGYTVNKICLGGGGAKSELWTQIIADILNIDINIPECEEASCLGSAIMAALGLGFFNSLDDAVKNMVEIKRTFFPIESNTKIYDDVYMLYEKLHHSLQEYYRIHDEIIRDIEMKSYTQIRTVDMGYYKSSLSIGIPEENLIGVLMPKEINVSKNLKECVNKNLDNPIGTPPFDEICAGKKKICVVICDLTRPMQTDKILPIILDRIKTVNPAAEINILIAQGTHRPLNNDEIDYLCGKGIRERYNVLNHEFNNPDALTYIEGSSKRFPIYINKLIYESDFKIAIGAVKPHPIFGWSGGAKIIIPGTAGYETTGLSHWNSCPYKGIEIMGREENPVRAEVEKVVGDNHLLDFIINAVLTEASEVADIKCGHFIKAHRACIDIAKEYYLKDISEEADAVLVGVGKWGPDLWLGSMGIYQAEFYVKKHGTIILFGACPEGVSPTHPEILQWGYRPYSKVKELVDNGMISNDLTLAAHLVHVGRVLEAREAECVIISEGISRDDASKLGFGYLDSPDQVMGYLREKFGDKVRILAIPGFNSTPVISSTPAK